MSENFISVFNDRCGLRVTVQMVKETEILSELYYVRPTRLMKEYPMDRYFTMDVNNYFEREAPVSLRNSAVIYYLGHKLQWDHYHCPGFPKHKGANGTYGIN